MPAIRVPRGVRNARRAIMETGMMKQQVTMSQNGNAKGPVTLAQKVRISAGSLP